MANSTASTLACYSMQSAKIPKTICDDLDKKVRRFIWGGNEDKRAIHLISWDKLQQPKQQGGIGVRFARQSNAAFLTKLGWRVLTEPDALWSRVLRYKYCKGRCDVDMFEPKTGMSNVWNGITKNARFLCEGMRVAVGNGAKTLFWDHKWVSHVPLRDLITDPIPMELTGATVEEMWEVGHGWKWDILSPYLQQDTLKLIQAHELTCDPELGDLLYWNDSPKGKFTIKSVMRIIRNESNELNDHIWDLIWKAPVQHRTRAFMWLACHDRLMSNDNRHKRHLTDSPQCYICGEEIENTLHILRDCAAARRIWRKIEGPAATPSFFQGDIRHWFISNLEYIDQSGNNIWNTYFCVTIWWIWRWRNCYMFGRHDDIPLDIGAYLQVRFDETRRSIYEDHEVDSNSNGRKREVFVTWKAPPNGWYALNSDGAAKGSPGLAGGGAIIRDHRGLLVSAVLANFGSCNSFRAEVMALTAGLELARDLEIRKILIQLDNLACVQSIKSVEAGSGECAHLINFCRSMINLEDWEVSVIHVFREGNRAADWLANQGVTQPRRTVILEEIPIALSRILEEDIRGVAMPRLIPP